MPTEPAPIRVETSGNFSGNDGAWSSVKVRVGSPPQDFEVFPATEIPETWVVLDTACFKTSSNCTGLRGGTFKTSKSPTWAPKNSLYELGAEKNLGLSTTDGPQADIGVYGFDTLDLQVPGGGNISLNQQVVVGINTTHFYRGNLGLAARPIIFGDTTTSPSFLQSLKDNNLIPSLSYGYTAGTSYHNSNASLTLGGYDSSRFTPNDVSFTLAPTNTRELVVGLQSIKSVDSTGQETTLLSDGILTLVDSTVPHIWLPINACQAFEKAFGITYDAISNLYLVNDTLHNTLIKENMSVIFQLSNNEKTGPSVNITLPYASFDLEIQPSYALVTKISKYFPLRQARDESQYTLGRTFLQESFLTVNYETKNFSISQAIPAPDSASHIIAISNDNTTLPTSTNLPPGVEKTSSKSHSLSTPAIAGIAIAIVLVALLVGGVLLYFNLKKRKGRNKKSTVELDAPPPHPRNRAELPGAGEHRYSGSTMVKGAGLNVDEKDQERVDQQEVALMNNETPELDGPEILRSELPSPDPNAKHELESPPPRSELSTPEPWPAEIMPSPEPRAEMPSGEIRGATAGEPLQSLENAQSPVSSPDSIRPIKRVGSQPRPTHLRMDSSGSEGRWNRAIVPTRPSLRHSRVVSSESEGGWTRDGKGFTHHRMDSSDSEISIPGANATTVKSLQNRAPSDSEPISPEQPPVSATSSRPGLHRRFDSNDSGDTFETRMEMSPMSPFFPPAKNGPNQSIQAIPSWPEDSLSALSSPALMSTKSGLLSPEPLEMDEGVEAETSNFRGRRH